MLQVIKIKFFNMINRLDRTSYRFCRYQLGTIPHVFVFSFWVINIFLAR